MWNLDNSILLSKFCMEEFLNLDQSWGFKLLDWIWHRLLKVLSLHCWSKEGLKRSLLLNSNMFKWRPSYLISINHKFKTSLQIVNYYKLLLARFWNMFYRLIYIFNLMPSTSYNLHSKQKFFTDYILKQAGQPYKNKSNLFYHC